MSPLWITASVAGGIAFAAAVGVTLGLNFRRAVRRKHPMPGLPVDGTPLDAVELHHFVGVMRAMDAPSAPEPVYRKRGTKQ